MACMLGVDFEPVAVESCIAFLDQANPELVRARLTKHGFLDEEPRGAVTRRA